MAVGSNVSPTSLSYVILVILSFHGFAASSDVGNNNKLLLISFDGFRWNYLDRTSTPNFDRIWKSGVKAVNGLTNAFITKTFPNHITLVTGQWEETHGIVANYMYDPALNRSFSPHDEKANTEAAWFDQGGEPIWVTNQLQKDGKSGVIMWVGGGAHIKGVVPTKYLKFNAEYKNESKIDTMIKWFTESDCNLGLIYFPQPDRFGHMYGPESEQVTRMIGGLDKVIGYLLDQLEKKNLLHKTNIIVTSDHGFASTPVNKTILLNEFVNPGTYLLESSNPIAGIWPHEGYDDAIYRNLSLAAESLGHFTVYHKEDIPAHFHYTHHRRIPPIIVVADEHYSFSQSEEPWHQMGTHGYDNRLKDMHPFFIATGPAFKSGFSVDTFESVDVYPLMCHILGLEPAPNNGSMDIVGTLLKDSLLNKNSVLKFFKKHNIGSVIVVILVFVGLSAASLIVVREMAKRRKERENIQVLTDDVEITMDEEISPKPTTPSDTSHVPLLNDQDF